MTRNKRDNCVIKQWRIRGRDLGARAPLNFRPNRKKVFGDGGGGGGGGGAWAPIIFRPNLKMFFGARPPPPPAYLRVWMTGPTLSQGLDAAL